MTSGTVHRDGASAEFFDGTARGELLIRRCAECGHHSAPPAVACAACGSPQLSWVRAAGTGAIATWTMIHGRPGDGEPAPRAVAALVELDEGPWLHARIVGVEPGSVASGQRVMVGFERTDGGEAVPVFRPEAPGT
jgi:uncharacterized OB-fold protein